MMPRTWIIIAIIFVLIGCVLFAAVMTALKWDFSKLNTVEYTSTTYTFDEAFSSISLHTSCVDVLFIPSKDGQCSVSCSEQVRASHSVTVQDGALSIRQRNAQKWYDDIGVNFRSPTITVSLPQGEYENLVLETTTGDVKISEAFKFNSLDIALSTGDIHLEKLSAKQMYLSVTTGDIRLDSVSCEGALTSKGTSSNIRLKNVSAARMDLSCTTGDIHADAAICTGTLTAKTGTGNVTLNECDAAELFIKTTTGDVKGSLCSDKLFVAETNTGSVNVPESTGGGKCEIITNTGDISIQIQP